MDDTNALHSAARDYLDAGLCVLPARRAEKRPAVGRWKQYQERLPTAEELAAWFRASPDAICVLCGRVSGHVEIMDFDGGGELFDPWWLRIPADLRDALVMETTPSGGRHVIYRCETPVCGNLKLAQRRENNRHVTLIETRGEGGLFLCAPTPGYSLTQGNLTALPCLSDAQRDALLQAAWELNECAPSRMDAPMRPAHDIAATDRPGDDFNRRGDVRELLEQHGWKRVEDRQGSDGNEYWTRPGKESGCSATLKDRVFYVFSSNAEPFEPDRAYSPFSVYALLECDGDYEAAASELRGRDFGADAEMLPAHDLDISRILEMRATDAPADPLPEVVDPGPMPSELLRIPGFVSEVMDHSLAVAPYPNPVMAFGGALSLQAFLAGRKVRDRGDNRTNIYLLGLAHSSAGKDQSRKVNNDIIHAIGRAECLGQSFASGEGIQDALFLTPSMLFQTDEIDGMLQSIKKAKDARYEAIMTTLLTMFSSANSVFPMRRKAGKESPGVIDQPNLVIFGTAVPNHYYEALSERMLTNGFFARMIILEAGRRPPGQEPSIGDLPPRVLETAKWWADYQPGGGNLNDSHPTPTVIEHSDDATRLLIETRLEAEAEYGKAEEGCDSVGTTVWGRVSEQTRKLSLLYAISENHASPAISLAAVQWASRFVMHQTRRMLFMAASHVADNPFHAECLKLIGKLRDTPGNELPHSVLLKRMKTDSKTFGTLIDTMVQQGDIEVTMVPRAGRHMRSYRLVRGVKHEGETSGGGET